MEKTDVGIEVNFDKTSYLIIEHNTKNYYMIVHINPKYSQRLLQNH